MTHDEEVRCPSCGAPVVLVYDWDRSQPWVRPWLIEVWRLCSCLMPARVTEYEGGNYGGEPWQTSE